MVTPPARDPEKKVSRDKDGGILILCSDKQYAGMYPNSLAVMLKCSLEKSRFIIDILEKIAANINLSNFVTINTIIQNLSHIIPDPPEPNSHMIYLKNPNIFKIKSLISVHDIADILNITDMFAQELMDAFNKAINDEETLEDFLFYANNYMQHADPQEISKKFKKPNDTKELFDSKKIKEILGQKAPPELHAQNLSKLMPLKNPETPEKIITKNLQPKHLYNPSVIQDNNETIYDAYNFKNSPHFIPTCHVIHELLNIDYQDVVLLLSSPQALANFLEINDTKTAKIALDNAAQGNKQSLLEIIEEKINEFINGIDTQAEAEAEAEAQAEAQAEAEAQAQAQAQAEAQTPEEQNNEDAHNYAHIELPENLPDTLRLAYKLKNRITAKSLAESFRIFGVEISQSLARFIIEEGGYGGTPPNGHRIVTTRMLENLIHDIEKAGTLNEFVKIYLAKVNNDLKSMLIGG